MPCCPLAGALSPLCRGARAFSLIMAQCHDKPLFNQERQRGAMRREYRWSCTIGKIGKLRKRNDKKAYKKLLRDQLAASQKKRAGQRGPRPVGYVIMFRST
jgi:hypothetical protein